MSVKKSSKNRVTLPKPIIQQATDLEASRSRSGKAVVLKPVAGSISGKRLKLVRAKIKALGGRERDIKGAIRWARRRPG